MVDKPISFRKNSVHKFRTNALFFCKVIIIFVKRFDMKKNSVKKLTPQREKEIEEMARRNYELSMQGYEFDDTLEDLENLRRILMSGDYLNSTNGRFV